MPDQEMIWSMGRPAIARAESSWQVAQRDCLPLPGRIINHR
jgi:hypothetical protein